MAHTLASYNAIVQEGVDGSFSATWTPLPGGVGTMSRIEDAPNPIAALRRLATQLRIDDDARRMINAIDNTDDD